MLQCLDKDFKEVNGWYEFRGTKIHKINPEKPISPASEEIDWICEQVLRWDNYSRYYGWDYDRARRKLQYTAPIKLVDMATGHLPPSGRLLDVGAGSGALGEVLIPKGFRLDGIDLAPKLLEKARTRGYGNLIAADVTCPDVLELFGGQKYDGIVSCGMFGDFVSPSFLPRFQGILNNRASLAIAGSKDGLEGLERVIRLIGFSVVDSDACTGHLRDTGKPVEYLFIVGKRG